jgi:hypothetical protein
LAVGAATAEPGLEAPSPENFGVTEATGKVAAMGLAAQTQREKPVAGQSLLARNAPWPNQVSYAVPAETELLPTPAAQDFIYYSGKHTASFGTPPPNRKTAAHQNLVTRLSLRPGPSRILGLPRDPGAARTRPIGHQLTVTKPAASITNDSLRLGLR